MNILILNNRDIKSPASGGAEVVTHQIAKRWVAAGEDVSILASCFEGGKPFEVVDGIKTYRVGNPLSVYRKWHELYKRGQFGKVDIIIDEYTIRPFLAPKYVKEKVLFLCHELAREKYFVELPFPINLALYAYFEPKWVKTYRRCPTMVAGKSTEADLINLGFNDVEVFPQGINFPPVEQMPVKETIPMMLFVGLLKKSNRVDDLLEVHRIVRKRIPDVQLLIAGRGPEANRLWKKKDSENIHLLGYISQERKIDLMTRANVFLAPGIREGWGLTVIEANARGTPVVGYDIPGYRDSICNESTGILCDSNPLAMAEQAIRILEDQELATRLSKNAIEWSKQFQWDNTARAIMDKMISVLDLDQSLPDPLNVTHFSYGDF